MTIRTKKDLVDYILKGKSRKPLFDESSRFAPANIALCKYWGKQDGQLNLPNNSSLSISLGSQGTYTTLSLSHKDQLIVNEERVPVDSPFGKRLFDYLDLFREPSTHLKIQTTSNLPIGAGLASSASAFASYALALNHLYYWQLTYKDLSILARLGSGSASRSIYHGFVQWQAASDPLKSYAFPIKDRWEDLCVGLVMVDTGPKWISSSEAMAITKKTSPLYECWLKNTRKDLTLLKKAIHLQDFNTFGEICEQNAMSMHATMLAAKPMIVYWKPKTLEIIQKVHTLRNQGLDVYLTEDAGPNVKLLFLKKDLAEVEKHFPGLHVIIPFQAIPNFSTNNPFVIRVDKNDYLIGFENKQIAHEKCLLHRAISVLIYRRCGHEIQVLLQKRHPDKYHSGGLWTNTCCSHPQPHADLLTEAQRLLIYEMGFSVPLKKIGHFTYKNKFANGLCENEYDHLFVGQYQSTHEIRFHPKEIQKASWVPFATWREDVQLNPQKYTVWTPHIVKSFTDYLNETDNN